LERAATAAADELSTEREGLEAKVEDTYRATRAARITFSEVGEQHGEALLGAIVELELLAKTAGETLTSSGGHHRNLLESISTARERLVAEEEKLSLTDPSLFTKPTSLSASIADDAFKSTKPSARHYRTALSTLERITSAMILSTDEGSYLITPVDARTINTWRKTNRDEALQLTSVLGEEINIAQNTYGVNVTTPKGSYHLSPLANFVRVTRTLMQGRSNELILLADLIGGGGSSDHRTDLIAHLAHLGTSAQVKEVRATVRRWAIVNREHLGKKYFTKEEPLGVPRDGYDALAHANWHHLYDTYMTNPHMGMMVVRSGAPERKGEILWAGPVDMRDAHKGLEERREVYRYLHGSTGEWTEINIKEIAGLDERATFHVAPFYTTSVEGVLTLRTNWAMTHDPTLLDFGWIYQMANQSVEVESFPRSDEEQNFGQFVHGLLSPISNTPPGETSPLTLHDVQNLAVAAYHVAMNRPSPIRLADVSDRALMGWIESIPDKIDLYDNRDVVVADLRREMSDANFRGFMAKLYLIYHYSDDMDSEAIAFRTALAIATVRNAQILESSVRSIGEIFDRNTNTIYRNMHDPLFTPLDGDLVSAHPELKKVGRGQLFAALKILEPNMATKLPRDWPIRDIEERLARAPVWLKPMMQRLPSMANLLTIVGLTYSSLPREFRLKFKGLFHLCFDNSRIPDEATRRSLKERLQKLYATEAQVGVAGHDAIIRALGENLTEGFTLARWLTGEADPWVEKPNSLDDRTPADRIRMLAPELMKAREFILEFFHEKVTEDREVNRISEAMRDFYRRNVELRSALVMIYFVLMKMQEEHRHKIFSFFELPSGDQSPTLFARIATKDDMISEIRKALKEPFGEDDAESNAARLTGMEYPHLPLELLSPISRLAYMAPSVFRQKQSLVDAAFGVARGNEQLVNLISFATKHSEFRPAVAALSLAMLRYDRGKRFRIYNAFEGTPDLTSDGFIDILVEHGLLPEMDAVCGDNPISNEELLLPAFELDASGPLSQTHIEHRIDELGMLPKPFTHAFQKLVDAHIGQEAATYKDELIRGGKYTPNITDTAIRDHVGSLFKAACMAQKKVILLAKLIDPTEGFYDRMTKQSQRKMMAGIEDIPKDVDVINHLVAWYGYTFMIEHRDEVLTARDRILGGGGSSGSSGSPGSSGSSGPESSGGGGVKGGGETASGDSETSLSPSIGSTTMPITQHPFIGSPPFLTGAQKSTWYPGCQLHGLSAARFHAAAPTMLLTHANDNFPVGMTSTVMGASQFVSPINTVGLTAMRPIMPM